MNKYPSSIKKIDYYQIEQETIRHFVQRFRAQGKPLPDTIGGMKLEDVPLVLMNIRTYSTSGTGNNSTSGTDKDKSTGKPILLTVDTYIGEDGGDFKFVGRCDVTAETGYAFSYASHVSSISSFIGMYLEIFYNNSCMESTLGLSSQRDNCKYKVADVTLDTTLG